MAVSEVLSPPRQASDSRRMGYALGLGAVAIWACYLALAKRGVSGGLTGMDFALLRFGTAGLVMLPWLLKHGIGDLAGVGWGRGVVLAAFAGPLFILSGVAGFAFAPLAHGALVQPATIVVASSILAAWVFRDRPDRARVIGIAVIVAGLVTIAGPSLWSGSAHVLLGDGLFVLAGLLWAAFTVMTRHWAIPALPATAAVSVLSMIVIVPIYFATQDLSRLAALPLEVLVLQVLVQGVLSGVLAVILFTRAVERLGPGHAAIFPAMVPAVAVLVGIPIAGEWPNAWQMLGLTFVTAGVLVAVGLLRWNNFERVWGEVKRRASSLSVTP